MAPMGPAGPACDVSALLLTAEEAELTCAAIPYRLTHGFAGLAKHQAEAHLLKARLLAFAEALFELGVGIYPIRVRALNSAPFGLTVAEVDLLRRIIDHRLQHDRPASEQSPGPLPHVLRKLDPTRAADAGEAPPAGATFAACCVCNLAHFAAMIGSIALTHGPPLHEAFTPILDERGKVALDRLELRLRAMHRFLVRNRGRFGDASAASPFAWTPREHVLTMTHLRVAARAYERRPADVPYYSPTTYDDLVQALAVVEAAPFVPVAAL